MKSSSGTGRNTSDATTQEVAVAEHRLIAVEKLRSALAVGQARRDAAGEHPDEDVSVAVATHDSAAFVTIADAECAPLRRVHLEDGVGAELDVEEDARRRALAKRMKGRAAPLIADRLHIAADGRLLGDELRGLREVNGALEDQIGHVEFPQRVGEVDRPLGHGMKLGVCMTLDDAHDWARADVADAERKRGVCVDYAVRGGDDDARRDERRATGDLVRVETVDGDSAEQIATSAPALVGRAADELVFGLPVGGRRVGRGLGRAARARDDRGQSKDDEAGEAPKEHGDRVAAGVPSQRLLESLIKCGLRTAVGGRRTPAVVQRGSRAWLAMRGAKIGVVVAIAIAAGGCRRREDGACAVVADTASADASANASASAEAAVLPARVERIRVPGDLVASVVRARGGAPTTVFLPGLCSNANAYLQAFPEAARRQGGIVAIEGDQPCGTLEGFRSFSWDASKLHARIEAAAAAAGLEAVPREGLTLVGYSQGAALGEQLVQRWPNRYARVILIGAPTEPSAARFSEARAIVTMSCSRDVPGKMKEATNRFVRAGIPSTYLEMPDCTHGNITDGDRTFDAAFDWLRANARPPRLDAKPQPLIGEG